MCVGGVSRTIRFIPRNSPHYQLDTNWVTFDLWYRTPDWPDSTLDMCCAFDDTSRR